jgi:hypothetical protein
MEFIEGTEKTHNEGTKVTKTNEERILRWSRAGLRPASGGQEIRKLKLAPHQH